jgi:hypothetical protein
MAVLLVHGPGITPGASRDRPVPLGAPRSHAGPPGAIDVADPGLCVKAMLKEGV